ncbi:MULTISPECIES: hypothetical protein [unclassified Janthinobacterium]|uniref:hypothetical protein n=1 Tax=unclassified Janthinobacterium TaxID=2610881 RepID=UPI0011132252|nr:MULTISPECIES: hypothetical protein [unclassified Janthinobacterium]
MKSSKYNPASLFQIIGMTDLLRKLPSGQPERILLELVGDQALAGGKYAEALQSYKDAKGKSWRLRKKIGWCCYQLDMLSDCTRYLEDARRHRESKPLAILIDCIAAGNIWGEHDDELDDLVQMLLELPDKDPYFYELADRHLINTTQRLDKLRFGYETFPENAKLRRIYTRALWGDDLSKDTLLALVSEAVQVPAAEPEDLWQGFEIFHSFGHHAQALELVGRIREISAPFSRRALAFVEADLFNLSGFPDRAAAIYQQLLEDAPSENSCNDLALHAARGLLQLRVERGSNLEIETAARSFASCLCRHGVLSIAHLPCPLTPDHIMIEVGTMLMPYRPNGDLTGLQDRIFTSVTDKDVRALFKVLFANQDGQDGQMPVDIARELKLSAGRESTLPFIQREVAWARMEAGDFEGAGRAFFRFNFAWALELPRGMMGLDDSTIFDEAPYNDEDVVDQFADGMLKEALLEGLAHNNGLHHISNILCNYLRAPLLEYKLHTRFYSMMEAIIEKHLVIGVEVMPGIWFDYALAAHQTGKHKTAISSYNACLEQEPTHSDARMNLLLLVPPAERLRTIIDHDIAALVVSTPPGSVTDMTLEQAVYLIALHRSCATGEHQVLRPFGENECPFAPSPEMYQPLFALLRSGLIMVSPVTPTTAFTVIQSPPAVEGYHLENLFWELPDATVKRVREIEEVCSTNAWPETWKADAIKLAYELARHECLAYLQLCVSERHLQAPPTVKALLMIDSALAKFSVSQVFNFLWQGTAGASESQGTKRLSPAHVANAILRTAQQRLDSARMEHREVKGFKRPQEIMRSQLSYTLHDFFLGFGDRSYTQPLAALFTERNNRHHHGGAS